MTSKGKSPNFTELEKNILVELIQERKERIENKQCDGKIVSKKNEEWVKLCEEYNSRHGVNQRNVTQLKSLWKNLKSRTKANVAKERREKKMTGGGPPKETSDSLTNTVCEMLPQQINSLSNAFDDDALLHGNVAEDNADENLDETEHSLETQANSPTTKSSDDPVPSTSFSNKTSFQENPSKCKISPKQSKQDVVKTRLLEIAEEQHLKKMKIMQLKEDVLLPKKQKLEKELKLLNDTEIPDANASHRDKNNSNSENNDSRNGATWRPFLL